MTADPVCRVLSWHSRELSSTASCWGRQVQSATSWEDTGPKHAHRSRATWRARAILNHWVLKNDLGGHHDKNRPCLVTKNHSPDGWEARLHASLNAFLHWEKIVNLFLEKKFIERFHISNWILFHLFTIYLTVDGIKENNQSEMLNEDWYSQPTNWE